MKTRIIICVYFLLASIVVLQAADTALHGKWKVTQVTIEKNTDGNIQTTEYPSPADVKSYILCPQEWGINAQSIVIRYLDGWEQTSSSYTAEGNVITTVIENQPSYQYIVEGETLILMADYSYVNNLPTGSIEHITEKWTIALKKQ